MPEVEGRLFRCAAGLTAGLLLAVLAACNQEPEEPGARAAAQQYVDLIAAGSEEDLEQLWRTTASDQSAQLRRAGRVLAGAADRVEVVEVGAAEDVEESVQVPTESDLDWAQALQVPVTYQLAGNTYDGQVVLAPHQGLPLEDPATWAVVDPLVAAVGPGTPDDQTMDVYIAGVHMQPAVVRADDPALLYPGVYEWERRADPYLESETGSLVALPGESVALTPLPVRGTDETATALTELFSEQFQQCVDGGGCGSSLDRLLRRNGAESVEGTGWRAELITPPQVSLTGDHQAELTGGVLRVHLDDGSAAEVTFAGTATWAVDWIRSAPTFGGQLDLWEVDR